MGGAFGCARRRRSQTLAACVLALCSLGDLAHAAPACPGFSHGATSPLAVDRFYTQRAMEILRAGREDDRTGMQRLVAPTAQFGYAHGDEVWTTRWRGPAGLQQMLRNLHPERFQTTSAIPGITAVSPEGCAWSVTLLLRARDPEAGILMRFDFVDGLLTKVSGDGVEIIEGRAP